LLWCKDTKIFDTTKPWLAKVRAFLAKKEGA